ncbi:MAG: pilus assembly protein PilM, partial [bacterium]|nr:pilus assembly protein PilM [bacterium]
MKIERGDASMSLQDPTVDSNNDYAAFNPHKESSFTPSTLRESAPSIPAPPASEGRQKGLKSPLLDLSDLLPHGISPQQFLAGQNQPSEPLLETPTTPQSSSMVDFELPPLPIIGSDDSDSEELNKIEHAMERHLKPKDPLEAWTKPVAPKASDSRPPATGKQSSGPVILQSIAVFDEVSAAYKQPRAIVKIGVEVSRAGIKWVAIQPTKNRSQLVGYGFDEFDPEQRNDSNGNYLLAIERIRDIASRFKSRIAFRLVIDEHLPIQVKLVELPQLAGEEEKRAIDFAVREELPFTEDRLEFRQWKLSSQNAVNQWLLLPFDHIELEEKLHTSQRLGIAIEGLYPQILIRSKVLTNPAISDSGAYAVLDVGATQSTMVIMNGDIPVMLRDIPVSGDDFTRALIPKKLSPAVTPQGAWKEAERIKYKYGYPGLSTHGRTDGLLTVNEVNTALRPLIETFTEELQRSLSFYAGKFHDHPIKKIILIGGGSQMKRFPEELSARTGIPVESVNTSDWVSVPEQLYSTFVNNSASYLTATLAALTPWTTPLNLLPKTEIRNLKLRAKEPLVAILGGAVVLLLLIIQIIAEVALIKTKHEQQQLFNRLMALEPVHQEYTS